jgi:NAD(P)-dependent dehydrogenase (short-subunit alcohol dehydrogenase family)
MPSSIDLPPVREYYPKLFLKSQLLVTPQPPPKDLTLAGQTAIITGSNSGIGLECVRVLLGHQLSRVVLAVRSTQKGEDAAAELRKKHPAARIEVWSLDMLSYDSIRAFVQRCASLERIDFVILNAGLAQLKFRINESTGHEEVFQVNYLSTAALAMLLLPTLKEKRPKGQPGRLTIVSSGLALTASFANRDAEPLIPSFDDPAGWNMSVASDRYSTSKLLGQMFVVKLKDFVAPNNVVVNLVDPGFVRATGLDRNAPGFVKVIVGAMRLVLGRTVKAGAWTYIDAAVVKGKETHGSFLYNWKVFP